jgi:hypothetical protein
MNYFRKALGMTIYTPLNPVQALFARREPSSHDCLARSSQFVLISKYVISLYSGCFCSTTSGLPKCGRLQLARPIQYDRQCDILPPPSPTPSPVNPCNERDYYIILRLCVDLFSGILLRREAWHKSHLCIQRVESLFLLMVLESIALSDAMGLGHSF